MRIQVRNAAILKILFILFAVQVPPVAAVEPTLTRAMMEQRAAEIDALILASKFAEAEQAVAALVAPNAPRTRINDNPAFTVLGSLFEPSAGRYQSALESWVKQRPNSALAWLIYSRWLHTWAWEARGTKFVQSIPGEASKVYQERLALAVTALAQAEALDKNGLLTRYLRLSFAPELGNSPKEQRAMFDAADKLQPHSWAIHSDYLQGLAPKWGGESEEYLFSEARGLAAAAPKHSPIVAAIIIAQNLVCVEHGGKKEFLSVASNWKERELAYRSLLSRFPNAGAFAATFASDAFLVGKNELGIEQLKAALDAEGDNPEVLKVQKRYGHLLHDPKSLGGTPKVSRDEVTPVLEAAGKAYREKNLPEAERLYRQATEMHPTRSNSWFMLGSIIAQQGRYKDAIAPLVRATELGRNEASYFTRLCHTRMMTGDLEQGVEDCTSAIAIDASEKYAYLNRAQAYRMLGKMKEADADLKIANSIK